MALLFSSGDLRSYFNSQISKMNYAISLLSLGEMKGMVKSNDYAPFIRNYRISVPQLEGLPSKDKIKPYGVIGARFSVEIPFSGDQNLFMLRPKLYDFNPPNVIVKEGLIVLLFDETESNMDKIYQKFKAIYEKIQNYLTWIEQDVVSHYKELEKIACEYINTRYEQLCRDEARDNLTLASDEDIDQSRRQTRGGWNYDFG